VTGAEPAGGARRESGLQPERTALAWNRTSLSMLGNAALLTLRDLHHFTGSPRVLPALLALVIAVATYLVGRHREKALRARPLPTPLAPRRQVHWIGAAVIVLIVVSAVALPV
jgi:uncharacterized membrane protein YidH (DUF202 family)